ncbi:phosphoglucosamine mutase [bacterium]|nr:phosphoglucosamine mutase [bacterium]
MAKKTSQTAAAVTPEIAESKMTPVPRKTRAKVEPTPIPTKPDELIVSISGVRGIAGSGLSPAAVVTYVDAFARLIKGNRVVVGHDARPSSKWIVPIVEGVLRAAGVDVVFVGMVATPTIGILVRKLKLAGGIEITASHNPIAYNGLKFFHSGGEFITADMLSQLRKLVADPQLDRPTRGIGKRAHFQDSADIHLQALLSQFPPPERVRASRRPTVVIDCCNSAGAELAPDVADAYGALFQLLHSDITKFDFPRGPEPTEQNLTALRRAVPREGADLGFALDPDADRLAIVDEKGNAIGEERTLVLAADAYLTLNKKKSPIVVNLSTSLAINEVAARHGVKVHRTAIGEANVVAGMRDHRAMIGGEGNGGVIVPKVHPGRDAATGIALILMGLQSRGGTLSEWNESFPNFVMLKDSAPLAGLSVSALVAKVKRAFGREDIDLTDGVKVTMSDRWLHVRPSNTEPIVRIFAEAPTQEGAQELIDRVRALLQS